MDLQEVLDKLEESMEERKFVDTFCGFLNPIMKEISNRIFTADF